jgi:hypothetical protein
MVAVNGDAKAKLAALEAPAVADALARDVGKAVADAAKTSEADAPDLAISIDREVPWSTVTRILGRVYATAGVRRIELLLTRGPAPKLKPNGPPEAGFVLASDFVALAATLAPEGAAFDGSRRFGEIAPELIARSGAGPIAIVVAMP